MQSESISPGMALAAVGGPLAGKSAPIGGADKLAPKVATPVVMAPKPNDIKFDEAQAHQNLQEAISMLNKQMAASKQALGFSYDNAIKHPVITVKNTTTGDVVRQIPSEEVLRMAHHIDELKGILFNKAS